MGVLFGTLIIPLLVGTGTLILSCMLIGIGWILMKMFALSLMQATVVAMFAFAAAIALITLFTLSRTKEEPDEEDESEDRMARRLMELRRSHRSRAERRRK